MAKSHYTWMGKKCRDFWSRTYYSSKRLRGYETGKSAYWGDRLAVWTTISYRRTAVHGLSATEADLIMKRGGLRSSNEYHLRERPDGLVGLFQIKRLRVSIREEVY